MGIEHLTKIYLHQLKLLISLNWLQVYQEILNEILFAVFQSSTLSLSHTHTWTHTHIQSHKMKLWRCTQRWVHTDSHTVMHSLIETNGFNGFFTIQKSKRGELEDTEKEMNGSEREKIINGRGRERVQPGLCLLGREAFSCTTIWTLG